MKDRAKAIWRRNLKRWLIGAGLEASAIASTAGLAKNARGAGAIFTLHHVRPEADPIAGPNRHLEVTPEFLDTAIRRLTALNYEFVPLTEVPARLAMPAARPFAAFTLDDGYRNNADHALPVFETHNVPFTIFVAKGLAEHEQPLWWEILGRLLRQERRVSFDFGMGTETIDIGTRAQKLDTFFRFATYFWSLEEMQAVGEFCRLAERYGIDPLAITSELVMGADELRSLAGRPLVSLGAHTVSHRKLSRLSDEDVESEMSRSADWLETLTGTRPVAIAYPYGSREAVGPREFDIASRLGFTIGVTTQPGTLVQPDLARPTALPRISLNGYYQKGRYVAALASGIPFGPRR